MDLSIVLVNWNGRALVEQCLKSIAASGTRCQYEVIVSDNASTDGSREWLRSVEQANPWVRCVLNADNQGFGVGNNRALPLCRGRHVLFLNTDTIVLEPLDALVAEADHLGSTCGAVGGRVLNGDKTLQLTCREPYTLPYIMWSLTIAFTGIRPGFVRRQDMEYWNHAETREVASLSGCYLLVPRNVLERVGGFDSSFFLFYEDTDLCYRIRQAGFRVVYAPVSTIIHLEGAVSRKGGLSERALTSSLWSARYFTQSYLGRGQARLLAIVVWLFWWLMWVIASVLATLMPFPSKRRSLRRRATLLAHAARELRRQRMPAGHRVIAKARRKELNAVHKS